MYTIEQTNTIDADVICKVMDIESKVFKPEDCGDFTHIVKRMERYPEMLILAKHHDEIVGYLCYFPISEKLHKQIMYSGSYFDDNIEPADVKRFERKNHVFIISAAIYPEYQNKGIADMMMEYMNRILEMEENKGNMIEDILTIVISEDGEKLVKRYHYSLIAETKEAYKIYRKV